MYAHARARRAADRKHGTLRVVTHGLILDVSSLMYRSHFALGDSVRASDGRAIGALHGYLDMVARLVKSRRPDEVVHAYDHDWRPVARTDLYAGYKATRAVDPEGLPEQFVLLREILEHTGMLQAQSPDWEAEDAIGAFCVDAGDDDLVEAVSGDRDLIQLVRDPVVKLLFTVRGVSELLELDEAGVLAKYGVPASRYGEFAILRGDPSDELPGVPGVGEKTARSLVQAYPSIDAMLEDAASGAPQPGPLKGKPGLRSKLLGARGYLEVMRRLVPINVDAKLELWAGERNDGALKALAENLGVKGPAQRMMAAVDSAGTA
jgi:5'-3' exonuclease